MSELSEVESCGLIDIDRLCDYWGDMHRYPLIGPDDCYHRLLGFYMLSNGIKLEVVRELDLLIEIAMANRYESMRAA